MSAQTPLSSPPEAESPLRNRLFLAVWTAGLISNVGAWMQTVGAQWLLVQAGSSAWEVALVQAAASLPVLVLAIPAGVLGEFVNRRVLLISVQGVQFLIAAAITILAALDLLDPSTLILLTFGLGACSAIQLPAYQAIIPEIVARPQITSAAALTSTAINIARAVGPAIAGVVVAQAGVTVVFALNVASFVVLLGTLIAWRTYRWMPPRPERVVDATRAGIRFIVHAPVLRSLYLRLGFFLLPGSALWALLPTIASENLGLPAAGYGMLLGALGAGAVAGSFGLSWLRVRLSTNTIMLAGSGLFGLAAIVIVLPVPVPAAVGVLVCGGVGWIGTVATASGVIQAHLPPWVRTRALSLYQLVLFGSLGVGALIAGGVSAAIGVQATMFAAGAGLVAVMVTSLLRPIRDLDEAVARSAELAVSDYPTPPPVDDDREVLVLISHIVTPRVRDAFLADIADVEHARRRTGARRWRLLESLDRPDVLVEAFVVGSWGEYVAQRSDRLTQADARTLSVSGALEANPPHVEHLLDVRHHRHLSSAGRRRDSQSAGTRPAGPGTG